MSLLATRKEVQLCLRLPLFSFQAQFVEWVRRGFGALPAALSRRGFGE